MLNHLAAKKMQLMPSLKSCKIWRWHRVIEIDIIENKKFVGKGRPSKDQNPESIEYKLQVQFEIQASVCKQEVMKKACFIIGSNDKKKTANTIICPTLSTSFEEIFIYGRT